jgi:outer membrane protein
MTQQTAIGAKVATAAILAAAVLGAQTAKAEEDKWRIRVGPAQVYFDESASLGVGGAPLPGGNISIKNNTTLLAEFGYRFTPECSAGLTIGYPPTASVQGKGSAAALGEFGRVTYAPAALTLQYQFNTNGTFKPYVGAGPTYFVALKTSDGALAGFNVKNAWGGVLQAGVEYEISKKMDVFVDIKKLFIDTSATGSATAFGGAPATANVTLNPLVI